MTIEKHHEMYGLYGLDQDADLRLVVTTALTNALEGGYDPRSEPTEEICRSLYDYDDASCVAADHWSGDAATDPWEILEKYIDQWKELHR